MELKTPDKFKNLSKYKPVSYKKFKNMAKAVKCIKKHIEKNSVIGILVDEDVDGITSASEMYLFLKENFNNKLIYIIQEKNKTHGLQLNKDKSEVTNINVDCDLLIIPDAGSENFIAHNILKKRGMDIIVIDHHDCKKYSENAIVVNNKMSEVSVNLTGSAMTFKFIEAINDYMQLNADINKYLDLVAFGLIGDSADTTDLDVQYYIQQGLKDVQSPMINAIIDANSFSTKGVINQETMIWYVSPSVNAVVRLGSLEERTLLFSAFVKENTDKIFPYIFKRGKNKGETIDEDIYEHCAERVCKSLRGKQQRLVEKIVKGTKKIEGLVDIIGETDNKVIVCDVTDLVNDDDGLTGLIANKIMSYYKRPTLVLRKTEDGKIGGSGRARNVVDFKDQLNATKVIKGGGHQKAFGVLKGTNKNEKVDKQIKLIKEEIEEVEKTFLIEQEKQKINEQLDIKIKVIDEEINEKLKDLNIDTTYAIDFKIPFNDFEDYMIEDLYALKDYFGKGLETPLIYIENVVVKTSDIETNEKFTTLYFTSNYIKYVKFKISEEYYENIVGWEDEMVYNIIGRPSINEYDGEMFMQIIIEDMEKVDSTEENEIEWDDCEDEEFSW